jgi:hypothetical protein
LLQVLPVQLQQVLVSSVQSVQQAEQEWLVQLSLAQELMLALKLHSF